MSFRRTIVMAVLLGCCSFAVLGQAKPEVKTVAPVAATVEQVLTVAGDLPHPLRLTAADLAKLPRRSVHAKEHDGTEANFEGVELVELLKLAGINFGEHLRGKDLTRYVLAEASDHYRVLYALAELDPGFTNDVVILADRKDGKPIDAEHGPFRIIAPAAKAPARWIRQVQTLTVVQAQPN
jgi:DMSO/TMAO reductase YedYZ molybdopterin-dependent catalytic subunit